MNKIKVGIIGAGMAWEKLHFPAYQRLSEQYEIAAICDADREKAQKAAGMAGLSEENVFSDYNEMLGSAQLDAVDSMVPIRGNYEVAKAVLKSGLSLIAEKPFASTVEAAKDLIKLGKKNGVKVLVAENYRYEEENRLIKDLITQNTIGELMYFIDNNVKDFSAEMMGDDFSAREWRQHPDFKGGVFLDSALHHVARLRYLFGEMESVYAVAKESDEDYSPYSAVNALMRFKSNISGHYTFLSKGKETQSPLVGFRIFGTNGEIYLEERDCGCINLSFKDGSCKQIYYKPFEGYYNELLNFYNSIVNDEEIVSTPEKELGDIEVIYDIMKSIEKNRVQKMNSGFPSLMDIHS